MGELGMTWGLTKEGLSPGGHLDEAGWGQAQHLQQVQDLGFALVELHIQKHILEPGGTLAKPGLLQIMTQRH